MPTDVIQQGDDEEFALTITDPVTEAAIDMNDHADWEVWVTVGDVLKIFSAGDLPVNADGTLQASFSQAETASLAVGSNKVWVKVRDSDGKEKTIIAGTHVFKMKASPLSEY